MSVRIFITYNLRPTTSIEEYRKFSHEIDQPLATKAPGILRFEVFEVRGAGEGEPDFRIVEEIEAESWQAWLDIFDNPDVKAAHEGFRRLCDPDSARTHWTERV